MNKDFIKKYNLEEAVKRFKQINEYTYITELVEDEDDNGQDNEQQPQNQPQDNGNGGQMPPEQGNGDSMQQPPMDNNANGGDMPPMDDGGMNEPAPEGDMMGAHGAEFEDIDTEDDIDTVQEDDEVIDVDDLTQSQEATEVKVDDVEEKLTKMLAFLDKADKAIELSNKKIDDLRQEFEKRNPTEQEKINIRSQASYPYSETPKDYWDEKKEKDSRYNIIYNNDVSTVDEPKEYVITQSDVENFNPKEIADSFDMNKSYKLGDFLKF